MIAFEVNSDFGKILENRMRHYNTSGGGTISAVQSKLDANIEQILERGEKLELLVDKTDQLQTQAFQFQKTSRKLKNAMYWRKVKIYAAVSVIVILLMWIISAIACGIDYSKCGNDSKK